MRLLLLDSGLLNALCHPRRRPHEDACGWVERLLLVDVPVIRLFVPEIADYEVRRDLIRLVREGKADQKSLDRLDELGEELEFLRMVPGVLKKAAELWADVRVRHLPFAHDASLDADVILAAQAMSVGGTVVTFNEKHLGQIVDVRRWDQIGI